MIKPHLSALLSIVLLASTLSLAGHSPQEQRKIDSLKNVAHTTSSDSLRLEAWLQWENMIYISDPALDMVLNLKIDSLTSRMLNENPTAKAQTKLLQSRSFALNNIGILFKEQGNYSKAFEYYTLSLEIEQILKRDIAIANSYNNIGSVLKDQGNNSEAIQFYTKSLKIREAINDSGGIADSYHNIASIYSYQQEPERAIEYYLKSLLMEEALNNKKGIATSLNTIGSIYLNQGNHEKAFEFISRSLRTSQEINDLRGVANSLNDLGNYHLAAGTDAKALELYQRSLTIQESIGNQKGQSLALLSIASIQSKRGNRTAALENGQKALGIAREMGHIVSIRNAAKLLYEVNKALSRPAEALEMFDLHIRMRDSITSEKNQKELIRQEYKFQYEKQAAADSVRAAEAQKVADAQIYAQEAQLEQERTQRYALFGGLGLLGLFGGVMFNRFRITREQKNTIEEQKGAVEQQKAVVEEAHEQLSEKNKEILDSIEYAKRIQNAILPPKRLVLEHLPNSFILYKPKDIVAGDFYWLEAIGDLVLFAAADCTGHGVPGAMVSVVCVNGLNRSVREFGLTDPAEILDNTRALVIKEFEKSEEDVKDGMDISLCVLHTKTRALQWAGANNPLWIVKAEATVEVDQAALETTTAISGPVLLEVKADKQPIGKYGIESPFTSHSIQLDANDMIYIFSDGYPDQFGGDNGKKYKSGKFKKTLIDLSQQPLNEQLERLDRGFENWRGTLEQIDDVCVIGVRV